MSSIKVTFVQVDGTQRTIENATPGWSLMEVGRAVGVEGILGTCGGGCSCATCHVYVDSAWQEVVGPPNEVEAGILDMYSGGGSLQTNSRLSCQIQIRAELDGLRVTVAPESGI
jgi:2Fe-2S ferredoxin